MTVYMSNAKVRRNIMESAKFISGTHSVVYECTRFLRNGNTEKIYLVSAGTIAGLLKGDIVTYTTVGRLQLGSSNKLKIDNMFVVNEDIITRTSDPTKINEIKRLPLWVAK